MTTEAFQGQIKRIQWDNQIISGLMMAYFLIGILIFVSLISACLVAIVSVFDPGLVQDILSDAKMQLRFARSYIKLLFFALAGAFYFVYRDFNQAERMFGAVPLDLRASDPFYRMLEAQCISRGLPVPSLYVIDDPAHLPPGAVTAVALHGPSRQSKLLISPAVRRLDPELQEAFIAQAVQRLHTKDTLFLTLLCFLGHFPFHLLEQSNAVARTVFKPFLKVTDALMAPARRAIINLRMAKLDVGSLELTKDKSSAVRLLDALAPLETISQHYHEAYLPLFIAKSDGPYRLRTLERA